MAATKKKTTDADRIKLYESRIDRLKTRQEIAILREKLSKKK